MSEDIVTRFAKAAKDGNIAEMNSILENATYPELLAILNVFSHDPDILAVIEKHIQKFKTE